MTYEFRIGLAGLGAAARIVVPGLEVLDKCKLVAVADVREDELAQFKERFPVETYTSVEEMCRKADVNVVYVATPNEFHAEHAITAAENGKHVIGEKPMAVTMDEANRMLEAVDRNGVKFVQGHSKIFRPVFRVMGDIIASGRIGRVIQIDTWMYNDWLIRPVLPSEVDEARGGGVVYRQGPHQMDITRYLAGGMIRSVRAKVGRWNPYFNIEGDYSAFVDFEGSASALIGFNGYGHLDSAELTWGIGEGGRMHSEELMYGQRPQPTTTVTPEERYNAATQWKQLMESQEQTGQDFFGLTIVSCERGIIRQSPTGLYLYTAEGREEVPVPPDDTTRGMSELRALRHHLDTGEPLFPDGLWGRASLEGCLAMLQSSKEQREIQLTYQVPSPLRQGAASAAV